MNLENRVKELRHAQGMTQEDLAESLGVSRQTVISIEGGRYSPSLPLALKIARVFRKAVEDVFSLGANE